MLTENSRIHPTPSPLALNGDLIGVYQDVILQMVEKEDSDLTSDDIENGNLKPDSKFVADRPFMVVLQIDNEVIAIGRVKVNIIKKTKNYVKMKLPSMYT